MSHAPQQGATEPTPAATPQRIRFHGLDHLRVIAAVDIIAFHVYGKDMYRLFSLGLPAFLVVALALVCGTPRPKPFAPTFKARAARLGMPWVLWCMIYLALAVALRVASGAGMKGYFDPLMLLYGTKEHLWFLPYVFVGSLVVYALFALAANVPRWIAIASSLLAGAGLSIAVNDAAQSGAFPYEQWAFGIPSVFFGLAFGRMLDIGDGPARRRYCLPIAAACAITSVLTWPAGQLVLGYYACAFAVLAVAISGPFRATGISKHLSGLTLGVYLVHIGILMIWDILLQKIGAGDAVPRWATVGVVTAASFAVTALIVRTPFKRFV